MKHPENQAVGILGLTHKEEKRTGETVLAPGCTGGRDGHVGGCFPAAVCRRREEDRQEQKRGRKGQEEEEDTHAAAGGEVEGAESVWCPGRRRWRGEGEF